MKKQANKPKSVRKVGPYTIGANYQIRTVTMIYTGKLLAVHPLEMVISDASWIADTGRFADACARGTYSEVEPYPEGRQVVIGRGAIVDAFVIEFPLPRTQK